MKENPEYCFAGHVTLCRLHVGRLGGSKVGAGGLGLRSACDFSPPWCLSVAARESRPRLCHVSRYLDGIDVLFCEGSSSLSCVLSTLTRPAQWGVLTPSTPPALPPFSVSQAPRVASGVLRGSVVAFPPLAHCVMSFLALLLPLWSRMWWHREGDRAIPILSIAGRRCQVCWGACTQEEKQGVLHSE